MASSPITSWQIDGEKVEAVTDFIFLGWKITVQSDLRHEIKSHLLLGRKVMTDLYSVLKSKHITLPTKVHIVHIVVAMVFPVVMYGWESWTMKDELWRIDYFGTVVLEKILENPLDSQEIKPVNPKGNNPWIFIGRTGAKAPILRPSHVKNWLIGRDPDAGKNWGLSSLSLAGKTWVWANSRR